MNAVSEVVFLVDNSGKIITANMATSKLLDLAPISLVGSSLSSVLQVDNATCAEADALSSALTAEGAKFKEHMKRYIQMSKKSISKETIRIQNAKEVLKRDVSQSFSLAPSRTATPAYINPPKSKDLDSSRITSARDLLTKYDDTLDCLHIRAVHKSSERIPVEVNIEQTELNNNLRFVVRVRDIRHELAQELNLRTERQKSDQLIAAMLPPTIASALREGIVVKPRQYEVGLTADDV